ncbi:MAG: helix-hairpin-helix domain-containing protein [Bacilli bacterium]|nr:helix-hairpin-helix domain-containing protein [Bacilli bacterium]
MKRHLFNIIISILLLIIILLLSFLIVYELKNKEKKDELYIEDTIISDEVIPEVMEEYIFVDVKGSVKKPNVYKLQKGARTIDAINASGGLAKNANTRFINLSKELKDGDAIVIYSNDEIKKAQKQNTIYVETPCICEEVKNDACYQENNISNAKININTSTKEELMTLSGIGESKANAIIEYRTNNGNFNVIEDVMKVSGISETIFNKIKENITV